MSRAQRRHHRRRMVAKAKAIKGDRIVAVKIADNLAICSCWVCTNTDGEKVKYRNPKFKY